MKLANLIGTDYLLCHKEVQLQHVDICEGLD